MTQEEKDLLLKYLCMALPYGVHLFTNSKHHIRLLTISNDTDYDEQYWINGLYDVDEVKPYLRSMSSMTQEEKTQMVHDCYVISLDFEYKTTDMVALWNTPRVINWLLEHHFDFLGLISKGLAIEVTEDNNPYKE